MENTSETEIFYLRDPATKEGFSVLEGILICTEKVSSFIGEVEIKYIHNCIQEILNERKRLFKVLKLKNHGFPASQLFYHHPSKNILSVSDGKIYGNEFYYDYSKKELNESFIGDSKLIFPENFDSSQKFYVVSWLKKCSLNRLQTKNMILMGLPKSF